MPSLQASLVIRSLCTGEERNRDEDRRLAVNRGQNADQLRYHLSEAALRSPPCGYRAAIQCPRPALLEPLRYPRHLQYWIISMVSRLFIFSMRVAPGPNFPFWKTATNSKKYT